LKEARTNLTDEEKKSVLDTLACANFRSWNLNWAGDSGRSDELQHDQFIGWRSKQIHDVGKRAHSTILKAAYKSAQQIL
jgi:hypothetical protein